MHVTVIDIGSPKNLGWSSSSPTGVITEGRNLDDCVDNIATALRAGPVALGFEAPMWVPTRMDAKKLTSARNGETGPGLASRPFSASAGTCALVTGMVIVNFVLRRLRDLVPDATAYFDWRHPRSSARQLLLWEAFVTNQRNTHDGRHVDDAKLAIAAFQEGMTDAASFASSVHEADCLNLIGAALLKAGWTQELAILSQPCLVVRTA